MKKTKVLMIALLTTYCSSQIAFAQCNTRATQKADYAYESKNWYAATELYKKARRKADREKKDCIYFYMAKSYFNMNEFKRAESYFGRLAEPDETFWKTEPVAIYYLALCYKNQGEYEKAMLHFNRYAEVAPDDPRGELGAKSCKLALKWKNAPSCYKIEFVKDLNSGEMDYGAFYSRRRNREIMFTSNRDNQTEGNINNTLGVMNEDLFYAEREGREEGEWVDPLPADNEKIVNTFRSEGAGAMDDRFRYMYFTRCLGTGKDAKDGLTGCQIYVSRKRGSTWSPPEKIKLAPDSFVTGHPTITADGNYMIFTSNMPGGMGGMDLWIAEYNRRGRTFEKPKNLGKAINTRANEMFPYIRWDGTLFFSSNRIEGMGGLDIYKAEQKGKEMKWENVQNMKYPINSFSDDFTMYYEPNNFRKGFFASAREGDADIISFTIPEATIIISGTVRDVDTKEPIPSATVTLTMTKGEGDSIVVVQTDTVGYYSQKIPFTVNYEMVASKKDYFNDVGSVSTMELDPLKTCRDTNMVQDFLLKNSIVELNFEVRFYLAETEWYDQYSDTLQEIVKIMKENPNITVQIGAHTDFRGSDKSNQILSEGRANAVISYLIKQGIDSARFEAKGFGETQPRELGRDIKGASTGYVFKKGTVLTVEYIKNLQKTKGDSVYEDAQQLNRRVTLLKLSNDYNVNKQGEGINGGLGTDSPDGNNGSGTKPEDGGLKEE